MSDNKTEPCDFVNGNKGGHLSYLFNSTRAILFIELSFCSTEDLTNNMQHNIFLCSIDRKYCWKEFKLPPFSQKTGGENDWKIPH